MPNDFWHFNSNCPRQPELLSISLACCGILSLHGSVTLLPPRTLKTKKRETRRLARQHGKERKYMEKHFLTAREAAAYLGVTVQRIYDWRCYSDRPPYGGPPAVKFGRDLRFRKTDLDKWIDAHTSPSTTATTTTGE
jgi:predicted DNA-binding transcriptional regulator AlpA